MYQAKENGRHGYQFYKPAMNLKAVERQHVEESLRHALDREEFTLHFQPKVNLHTGEIAGAEALLRWEHPTRGPMPPSIFVPVAEASGLIQPIGSWVMREACRQTQAWIDGGLKLPSISVNVSAMELSGSHFLDGVFEALNGTGLDPRVLELELTESALMKQSDATHTVLQALRAGGVQMSVDDFGTGYSNLSFLRKFPIHTLKIDQSFVREITRTNGEPSVGGGAAQHGPEPQSAGRRRGRRDARGAGLPAVSSLRRGAGLLFQPAAAGPAISPGCCATVSSPRWRRGNMRGPSTGCGEAAVRPDAQAATPKRVSAFCTAARMADGRNGFSIEKLPLRLRNFAASGEKAPPVMKIIRLA